MQKYDFKYHVYKIADSLIYYLLPALVFFAPVKGICITVMMFVILDTATGIWKSKKNGIPITSRGLYGFVSKSISYQAFILLTYTFGYHILDGLIDAMTGVTYTMTKLVSIILMYIEVKSINENYHAVTGVNLGKEIVDLLDNFKKFKSRINDKDGYKGPD